MTAERIDTPPDLPEGITGIVLRCPFCRGERLAAVTTTDHEAVATHELPWCREFTENDPDVYLRKVRLELVKTAPS